MTNKFYPLQFYPILKDRIWGGTKLKSLLGKPIEADKTGESWELSCVADDVSIIANGAFKGKPLTQLLDEFPEEILGHKVSARFGTQFPLLFKFLDAREDLSIQVHPNDVLAKERHNSFGKTEMWYVMQADPDSRIIVGFKKKSSPEEYLENLKNKTLPDILGQFPGKEGDVFFLDTGTIHAIGAGIVIAEIQQTSDITYRIYDWDRVDDQGKSRELHVDLALGAMNYDVVESKREYSKVGNESNLMVTCPYFTTNFIPLDGEFSPGYDNGSFKVLMCVGGTFKMAANGTEYEYSIGDTILIPASLTDINLKGKASILEIYIS